MWMVGQVLDFRKLDANAFAMTPKSAALLPLADSVCRHCRAFLMPTVDLKCVPIEPLTRICGMWKSGGVWTCAKDVTLATS